MISPFWCSLRVCHHVWDRYKFGRCGHCQRQARNSFTICHFQLDRIGLWWSSVNCRFGQTTSAFEGIPNMHMNAPGAARFTPHSNEIAEKKHTESTDKELNRNKQINSFWIDASVPRHVYSMERMEWLQTLAAPSFWMDGRIESRYYNLSICE